MEKGNVFLRTVLSTVVTALGVAVPASAADEPEVERVVITLNPLQFTGVSDEEQGQKLWNELMKYKLWGTESFSTKEDFKVEEPSGYSGTANGSVWFKEHTHTLGGPIISAQDLDFRAGNTQNDKFIKGPVYANNLYLPDNWNNGRAQSYEGTYCFEGDIIFNNPSLAEKHDDFVGVVSQYVEVIHNNKGKIYANWDQNLAFTDEDKVKINLDGHFDECPTDVPRPEKSLTVPVLNDEGKSWGAAIELTSGGTEVEFVQVPPVSKEDFLNGKLWYDKYVQKIYLQNHGKTIYIVMPSEKQNCYESRGRTNEGDCHSKAGRLTRVFSKEGIEIKGSASDARILVAYVNDDVEWQDGAWKYKDGDNYKNITEENLKVVPDDEYAGNLLFYTPVDIEWPQMETGGVTDLQGTYMTAGDFTIQDHMNIAGQLIAGKNLTFGANFNGKFHYVPFNSPEIKTDIFTKDTFTEKDNYWYSMDFYLTDVAYTEVSFDYCFEFFGYLPDADTKYAAYKQNEKGTFATIEDLGENPTDENSVNFMPFCHDNKSKHVVIKKGERKPTIPYYSAHISVVEDGVLEGPEYMLFKIMNLNGAVISGNKFDGGLLIKLLDSDNKPPKFVDPAKTKLAVPENAVRAKAGTITAKDEEDDAYKFAITGGTAMDLFEIDESSGVVTMKSGTEPFNYEAWKEDGTKYTLEIELCDVRASSFSALLCTEGEFTVSITDVNETPYFDYEGIANPEIKIAENLRNSCEGVAVSKCEEKVKYKDLDTLSTDVSFMVTKDEVIAIGGDTDVFDVLPNGVIVVNKDYNLDYETKNTYTLKLRVRDANKKDGSLMYPDLYDEMTITIKVTDVDDGPVFDLATYNGNVDENSIEGTEVNMDSPIFASTTQKGATITYSLIDETNTFVIDPSTGVITVAKDAVIDFETKDAYEMTVVASDEDKTKTNQTVQTATAKVIIKVNDLNENPIFVEPAETITFPEDTKKGSDIATLTFDDLDAATKFRDNRFECLECDDLGFYLDPKTGTLSTTRLFDYENDAKTYDLTIVISDASKKDLMATGTVTVKLTNVNEPPYLTNIEFHVPENEPIGTALKDNLEAIDIDGPDIVFTFHVLDGTKEVSSTKEFKVDSKTGVITVATALDYEKTDSYSIRIRVRDEHDGFSDTTVTIIVDDVNEAPSVTVDTIYVSETQVVNKPFSTVKTDKDDPDVKNADFRNNVYENIDDNKFFRVDPNGDVVLLQPVDYESDSIYTITVRVSDKDDSELTSTKKVFVKVKDVYEQSVVEITRVETPDSIYLYPDSVWVNVPVVNVEWKQDEKTKTSSDSLKLGCNKVIKKYKDPSKNAAGADTVIVCYSTATPLVTVTANGEDVEADNIYTVVEKATKNDSAIYVNDTKNDIKVTVKDTAANVSKSFTVKLDLDTVSVPSKEFKNVTKIADSKVSKSKTPASGISSTPENGDYTKNTYTETVNGVDVTVTYYTDKKGKDVKRSVITSSGDTKNIAVIEVSYTTTINGKVVTISYFADAETGERVTLNTGLYDSESVLSADGDDVTGAYKVSYQYVDKNGNTVDVSYYLDEKGKVAKNKEGNIGYNVGYTYVNKYSNSSRKEVFIVLDQKGPVVKIESPSEDDVLTSTFTVVKWTVNGVEQDTLKVQGLENGVNTIVRVFRDKAGNESRDSVHVMVKNVKNINIDVEKPVTKVDRDSVEKYYKENKPAKNQTYSVTFLNHKKDTETEVLVGIKDNAKEGSGEEPYSGFEGGHLGPTLAVDARVPVVNAVGGLATLDDIMSSGGMIALEGVDAANGTKIPVNEYVEKYCTDEFKESMTSDYSHMNLYWTTVKVKVWVFTNTGSFIDYYSFEYNLDDPDYVSEAGLLKFFFELKPDANGNVRTKDGRLYGTGAYLFKTEVKMSSKLRCTLPPISDERADLKKNAVIKTSDDLLKSFGYRRPVDK